MYYKFYYIIFINASQIINTIQIFIYKIIKTRHLIIFIVRSV